MLSPREIVSISSAVVLDFDDTIAATFSVRSHSLVRALKYFDVDVTPSSIASSWGVPFDELLKNLAPMVALDDFLGHYRTVMANEPPKLLPGAKDLLQHLQEQRKPAIVHSSSLTELVEIDLNSLGVLHLVNEIYGFDRTGTTKPDPNSLATVMALLESQGHAKERIVYVGDSVGDFMVACGNGLMFIGVVTGRHTKQMFHDAGFQGPVADSLTELCQT